MDESTDWNGRILKSAYWFSFQITCNDSICNETLKKKVYVEVFLKKL
jgi:hypothetical protein